MKILLVEDHADTAVSFAKLLALDGHSVEVARGQDQALELARHHPFDVLLCDIGLPDGDGCELLKELLSYHPVKAVAITGYGAAEDVERAMQAGFLAHLVKPVSFEKIDALLKQFAMGVPDSSIAPNHLSL